MNTPSLNPHEGIPQETCVSPLFANFDRQKAFDTMLNHLRKQGKPSVRDGWCVYRDDAGNKCAVGALIPDAVYTPEIEDMKLVDIVTKFYGTQDTYDFLREAQRMIHDRAHACLVREDVHFLITLEVSAFEFAKKYGLHYTPPYAENV